MIFCIPPSSLFLTTFPYVAFPWIMGIPQFVKHIFAVFFTFSIYPTHNYAKVCIKTRPKWLRSGMYRTNSLRTRHILPSMPLIISLRPHRIEILYSKHLTSRWNVLSTSWVPSTIIKYSRLSDINKDINNKNIGVTPFITYGLHLILSKASTLKRKKELHAPHDANSSKAPLPSEETAPFQISI